MRRLLTFLVVCSVLLVLPAAALAQTTIVPGHDRDKYDTDHNGYPDEGVTTTGKYVSIYAYDAEDYWWDLGDGRIQGTVPYLEDLDSSTLTVCTYQVQYRGKFENEPFLDSGWIMNNINCAGFDDNGTYMYLIVHETDPRYEGNPDWAIWGDWEYHVLVESGHGNLVRPQAAVGAGGS